VKYLNNVIEADHGKLKQPIRPIRGSKTLKTAYATIAGFEVMLSLRKGQAAIFNLTCDICGEVRIVERAFGLGPSVRSAKPSASRENAQLTAWLKPGQGQSLGTPPLNTEV
jgi:IS6 family transposase